MFKYNILDFRSKYAKKNMLKYKNKMKELDENNIQDRTIVEKEKPKKNVDFLKKTTELLMPRKKVKERVPTPRFSNKIFNTTSYKNPYLDNTVNKYKTTKLRVNIKSKPSYKHCTIPLNNYVTYDEYKYNTFIKSNLIYVPCHTLPAMGWIQLCIFCEQPTSRTEKIKHYEIYTCNQCKKTHTFNEKFFNADYIYKNI
jgi:hypothetical protein